MAAKLSRVHLLDGQNLSHQYCSVNLEAARGVRTAGAGHFLSLIAGLSSDVWWFVFDPVTSSSSPVSSRVSWRRAVFAGYKKRRSYRPAKHRPRLGGALLAYKMLARLGCVVLRHERAEADDLLYSFARRLVSAGIPVTVHSGDKDMLQTIETGATWRVSRSLDFSLSGGRIVPAGTVLSASSFSVATGLPNPRAYLAFRALMGDVSDGIPGAPGVGPVRSLRYIRTLYNGPDSMPAIAAALERDFDAVVSASFLSSARLLDLAYGEKVERLGALEWPEPRAWAPGRAAALCAVYGLTQWLAWLSSEFRADARMRFLAHHQRTIALWQHLLKHCS